MIWIPWQLQNQVILHQTRATHFGKQCFHHQNHQKIHREPFATPDGLSLPSGEARTWDSTCARGHGARLGVGSVSAGRPNANWSPGADVVIPDILTNLDPDSIWIWPGYDLDMTWIWSGCEMVLTLLLMWRTRRRRGRRHAALIKSRGPYLASGEKYFYI